MASLVQHFTPIFSTRTPSQLAPNRFSEALARARAAGRDVIDLTESNPTRAGFDYPPDLLTPLAHSRALAYRPEPFGLVEARRAVAADYARRGVAVSPERIILSASTSEAYSILFKLLADPGDEVLVPRPSYPLFDYLTRLDACVATPYDLEYHRGWSIDFATLEAGLSDRTRAILVVSPNNPTGSFVKPDELLRLQSICRNRRLALVADEVFTDYDLKPDAAASAGRVMDWPEGVAFSLGGLSKSIGLPQVKLGWIAAAGPDVSVQPALERLELICDTYLSVSTPVQAAAAELLHRGASVRGQIQERIRTNHRRLLDAVNGVPECRVLDVEGGWYAVLQVPSLGSEEDLVLALLNLDDVVTHPGYFFDFARESYLIVSLLPPHDRFDTGINRVLARAVAPGLQSRRT